MRRCVAAAQVEDQRRAGDDEPDPLQRAQRAWQFAESELVVERNDEYGADAVQGSRVQGATHGRNRSERDL